MSKSTLIVVGDIGGTNARFAAFETSPRLRMIHKVWLKTGESGSFDELFENAARGELADAAARAGQFVFAVAGPVVQGTTARLPNVAWPVNITTLRSKLGRDRVTLINDFVAQAFATKTSIVDHALPVKSGDSQPGGLVSVIGAGTGLGHCSILTTPNGGLMPVPSEASHQAFAFRDDEREFDAFARARLNVPYITADLIVCGRGLTLLHQFHHNEELGPADVASRLNENSSVLTAFARFYGRACRHYALAVLPTGGMYIAGGVASRNPILVTHPVFTDEFLDALMHRNVLEKIPIRLNAEQESGLWGAALYGATRRIS